MSIVQTSIRPGHSGKSLPGYAGSLCLLLLLSLLCSPIERVQAGEFTIKLKYPPPNKLRAADLWNLTIENTTNTTYSYRLIGTLDEAVAGRVADGQSGVMSLPPGRKSITYDDVKRGGTVAFRAGRWRDAFTRTGNAPSGDYTICITVKSEAGEELGKDCIEQRVEISSPPTLISPADGDAITEGQPLIFTWMPPAPASSDVTYELKLVEIHGNQSPEDAMKRNTALFEKADIKSTTFPYPASARRLETKKKLIWSVEANGVRSEIFAFNIGKEMAALPPVLISPANGDTIPQGVLPTFSWRPDTPGTQYPEYTLKIVEMLGNQSPEDAMRQNAVWYENTGIRTTTFKYPTSARRLETGKNIIWSVKAKGVYSMIRSFRMAKGDVRTDSVPTNCASLKAEFIRSVLDTACFQVLMHNNSSDSSGNTQAKSFRILLKNDSISSIEGGVSTGWARDRDKFPPPVRDVTWTSASRTIPRGKTNFGNICVGSAVETLYIAYEWLNSERNVICQGTYYFNFKMKSGHEK